MIIGVVSDIHGRLSNKAYEALSGSDYILCAGDIENRMVLTELAFGRCALSYGASSGRHRHGAR